MYHSSLPSGISLTLVGVIYKASCKFKFTTLKGPNPEGHKNPPKPTNPTTLHPSPYFNSNFWTPNPSITLVKAKFLVSNLIISYYMCIKFPKVVFILFLKYITSQTPLRCSDFHCHVASSWCKPNTPDQQKWKPVISS